jgi:hypothetical protein
LTRWFFDCCCQKAAAIVAAAAAAPIPDVDDDDGESGDDEDNRFYLVGGPQPGDDGADDGSGGDDYHDEFEADEEEPIVAPGRLRDRIRLCRAELIEALGPDAFDEAYHLLKSNSWGDDHLEVGGEAFHELSEILLVRLLMVHCAEIGITVHCSPTLRDNDHHVYHLLGAPLFFVPVALFNLATPNGLCRQDPGAFANGNHALDILYCCLQSTSPSFAVAAFASLVSRYAASAARIAGGFSNCLVHTNNHVKSVNSYHQIASRYIPG